MNLWLDDLRPAPDNWYWAKTVEEAIKYFESCSARTERIQTMSLDHDLGYEKTGYDFCKYLIERWYYYPFSETPTDIYLHTANPVGRNNMQMLLVKNAPVSIRIHRGPHIQAWEESMRKVKNSWRQQ